MKFTAVTLIALLLLSSSPTSASRTSRKRPSGALSPSTETESVGSWENQYIGDEDDRHEPVYAQKASRLNYSAASAMTKLLSLCPGLNFDLDSCDDLEDLNVKAVAPEVTQLDIIKNGVYERTLRNVIRKIVSCAPSTTAAESLEILLNDCGFPAHTVDSLPRDLFINVHMPKIVNCSLEDNLYLSLAGTEDIRNYSLRGLIKKTEMPDEEPRYISYTRNGRFWTRVSDLGSLELRHELSDGDCDAALFYYRED